MAAAHGVSRPHGDLAVRASIPFLLLLLMTAACSAAGKPHGRGETAPAASGNQGGDHPSPPPPGEGAARPAEDLAGEVVHGRLGRDLDNLLTDLAADGFAGAALVARRGTIFLKKGYGLADRARGLANDSETLFDVGGMARILTAAAILKLREEGRVVLDTPVSRYLTRLAGEKDRATIHQVLISTSGLASADSNLDGSSRSRFVDSVRDTPAGSAPGAEFHPSAAGYSLLAAVIEEVTGQPFERYLDEAILQPAGMTSTGFAWDRRWRTRRVAVGYSGLDVHDLEPVEPPQDEWELRGPGNLVTTVGDLYRWVQALERGTVLSPATVEEMLTAYIGTEGYSWHVIEESTRGRLVRRGGAVPGFESSLRWYRDQGLVVIFMVNSNIGYRIPVARGIAEVLERHMPSPVKKTPGS